VDVTASGSCISEKKNAPPRKPGDALNLARDIRYLSAQCFCAAGELRDESWSIRCPNDPTYVFARQLHTRDVTTQLASVELGKQPIMLKDAPELIVEHRVD
jgi:hypothetical protein